MGSEMCIRDSTRVFKQQEVSDLTAWMCDVLDDLDDESKISEVKSKVLELCSRFPVYM